MYDVLVIGAGIIGSAVAYYLSFYNIKVGIIEKCNDVACGTSKANSAIIHAGYDPKENTKMARLNLLGSELTKEVCAKLDIPYQQCGALVLAFNAEEDKHVLELYQRGLNNKVKGLKVLNHDEVLKLEPNLSNNVTSALLAKTSAIISPWEFTIALAEIAIKNGTDLLLNNEVQDIRKINGIFQVKTNKNEYQSKYIINCAGLYSDKISEMVNPKYFTINSVKGEYYLLDHSQADLVSHTIFQCPNKDGKGVLVSPTFHHDLIIGPNAVSNEKDDLSTTYQGLVFVKEKALKSVPSIDFRENVRNFAGNRAKSEFDDFIIEETQTNNFYNCAAICSPGLSSALAIGQEVLNWLKTKEKMTKKEKTCNERHVNRINKLSIEEKNKLIKERPEYGQIICRCESITKGEILDALHQTIPAVSIDGIKRRVSSGMGRCQGGFCSTKIAEIMREENISPLDIIQDQNGSNVLFSKTKVGKKDDI